MATERPAVFDPGRTTHADLVARAGAGDQGALVALLGEYGPRVRARLAGKISSTWQSVLDADDVMQVTYLEAFLRIDRFVTGGEGTDAGGAFQAWLAQIAENNLRDAIRHLGRDKRPNPRRRVRAPAGEDSFVALVELLGVTTTTPSRQAGRAEIVTFLQAALDKLPPDYAKAVRLYDLEGCSSADAAKELGRSPGAFFMLLARARDRLRETLGTESMFFSTPA